MKLTSFSHLVPAVYYAHLIAHRARHHENVASKDGPTSGPYIKLTDHDKKKPKDGTEGDDPVPLLKMVQNETRNDKEMWFVWLRSNLERYLQGMEWESMISI